MSGWAAVGGMSVLVLVAAGLTVDGAWLVGVSEHLRVAVAGVSPVADWVR